MVRLLLIQIRDAGDPMAEHERACVARRVGDGVALTVHNALTAPAQRRWLDGVDGLVIGGSGNYSVHHPDSQPWVNHLRQLLDAALAAALPGFGICFGHQLLGYHLGARVLTDEARAELGTVPLQLTAAGQRDPIFGELEPDFFAHTGHSDHVAEVPEGATLLASGDDCPTQAFKLRDAPFYSTQFHPDLTGAEAASRYLAYRKNLDGALDDPSICGASRFRPGADQTSVLLGRFAAAIAAPSVRAPALGGVALDAQ